MTRLGLRGGAGILVALLMRAPAIAGDLAADLRSFAEEQPEAVAAMGARIRRNETGGVDQWLLAWLVGEDHLSLGIGHFIWYPANRTGPFHESFPHFLAFLNRRAFLDRRESQAPTWLTPETPCPWPNRAAFLAAAADPRLAELRNLIEGTVGAQTAFLIERLASSIPALLAAGSAAERPVVERRLERLLRPSDAIDPDGVYALVDYVNFKGEGLAPAERHQGEGWGLLQVLQGMGDGMAAEPTQGRDLDAGGPGASDDPLAAFARSAAWVLERRVALSPPERREVRWLNNWRARVATYARGLDG